MKTLNKIIGFASRHYMRGIIYVADNLYEEMIEQVTDPANDFAKLDGHPAKSFTQGSFTIIPVSDFPKDHVFMFSPSLLFPGTISYPQLEKLDDVMTDGLQCKINHANPLEEIDLVVDGKWKRVRFKK